MLIEITQPEIEPVSLAEALAQLNGPAGQDDYVSSLISAAREYCEQYQGRAYISRLVAQLVDLADLRVARLIELPMPPLIAVELVQTLDMDGAETTLASNGYRVNTAREPARVKLLEVPSEATQARVTYHAGYGTAGSSVPARMRQAILLLVTHWFANREPVSVGMSQVAELPFSVRALLDINRVSWL